MADVSTAALVNIRGWLEGSQGDVELVQQFTRDDVVNSWYNFGWRFPNHQSTGHWYAFFGLHVYEHDVDWFLNQLRHLALLTASDTKPSTIRGLFVISGKTTTSQVQVRGGQVHLTPGDPQHSYLDA